MRNLVLVLRLKEEEGILRCQGRLKNSDLEFDNRYPIILPKSID